MKKFLLFSFIIATLIISGCGSSNKSASKNYTYENLDDGQKQIVDTVFDEYTKWKSVQDSGKTFFCSKVNFFYEGDKLIFVANYNFSSSSAFEYAAFYVDDGHLTSRTYDAYEDKLKAKATGAAMSGLDFSKDDSTETKKNTLSNAYYKAVLSYNSN